MLDMQKSSFRRFLQDEIAKDERQEVGLHAAFNSVFQLLATMVLWRLSM